MRKKPYTEIGIKRTKCFVCGDKAKYQWQICADNNIYRPICAKCDIQLNKMILDWAFPPEIAKAKYEKYKRYVEGS